MDASTWAAVGAWTTLTTRISASVRSVVPSGSGTSDAWIWVPAVRPSTETSICSGMLETSASTSIVFSSWVTRVSTAASPVTTTWTSTPTFSPRVITTRSTCSM